MQPSHTSSPAVSVDVVDHDGDDDDDVVFSWSQ